MATSLTPEAKIIEDAFVEYGINSDDGRNAAFLNVANPNWKDISIVHNWRNHIPDLLKMIWNKLPLHVNIILYLHANEKASNENWDD